MASDDDGGDNSRQNGSLADFGDALDAKRMQSDMFYEFLVTPQWRYRVKIVKQAQDILSQKYAVELSSNTMLRRDFNAIFSYVYNKNATFGRIYMTAIVIFVIVTEGLYADQFCAFKTPNSLDTATLDECRCDRFAFGKLRQHARRLLNQHLLGGRHAPSIHNIVQNCAAMYSIWLTSSVTSIDPSIPWIHGTRPRKRPPDMSIRPKNMKKTKLTTTKGPS